jgi:hypothetical protein
MKKTKHIQPPPKKKKEEEEEEDEEAMSREKQDLFEKENTSLLLE